MLIKTITFQDLDGKTLTEDFMFHMSKAEIAKLQLSQGEGGFEGFVQDIAKKMDAPRLIAVFEDLILNSYGERSPDGRQFIKSEELSRAFSQTDAYSELFLEIMTDAKKAAEFFVAVVPKDIGDQITADEVVAAAKGVTRNTDTVPLPPMDTPAESLTIDEVMAAAQPELQANAEDSKPAWLRENRPPTQTELMNMDKDEMRLAFAQRQNMDRPRP